MAEGKLGGGGSRWRAVAGEDTFATEFSEAREDGDNNPLEKPLKRSGKKERVVAASVLVGNALKDQTPLVSVVACSHAVAMRNFTIAFAESATAGMLCYEFSQTPHAGKIFKGGVVCYDAGLKKDIFQVPAKLIKKYTPESAEVTQALAEGLPRLIACDIAVAVTGLTTPGGSETPDKPVGTIFVHICVNDSSKGYRRVFAGSPQQIVSQATDYTASLVLDMLRNNGEK